MAGQVLETNDIEALPVDDQVDVLGDAFECEWRAGKAPSIEGFLHRASPECREKLEHELRMIMYELQWASTRATLSQSVGSTARSEAPVRLGRYKILREIESGAFGCVYLAADVELARRVAIKIPHPNRLSKDFDPSYIHFEGRTLATLDHPGIVPVYDIGQTPEGVTYIVAKYIEGGNLALRLAQRPPSIEQSVRWTAELADAIHSAHQHGFIHCDIKPRNILLELAGSALITDFGLALRLGSPASEAGGTPAYMSPEQATGGSLDRRSDIFSLGLVLYELLTGARPYQCATIDALRGGDGKLQIMPPRMVNKQVSAELNKVCMRALAQEPSQRYATAEDFASALNRCLNRKSAAGRRWMPLLAAAVLPLVIAVAGLYVAMPETSQAVRDVVFPIQQFDDREVAQRTIRLGGIVSTATAPQAMISNFANLPAEDFSIDTIEFTRLESIGNDDLEFLARASNLNSLRELSLARTGITNQALSYVNCLHQVQHLYLNLTQVDDEGLKLLRDCTKIKHLNLTGTEITDQSGPLLGEFRLMEQLHLSNTMIGDGVVAGLKDLQRLEVLGLRDTAVTDASIDALLQHQDLIRLDVAYSGISDAGVERLRQQLPNCSVIAE